VYPCCGGVGLLNSVGLVVVQGRWAGLKVRVLPAAVLPLAYGELQEQQPGAAASGPCLLDLGGGGHPERGVDLVRFVAAEPAKPRPVDLRSSPRERPRDCCIDAVDVRRAQRVVLLAAPYRVTDAVLLLDVCVLLAFGD
jgi:hypothetical protein